MKLDNADWPTFGWITDMRSSLAQASHTRQGVVLGTLIRVEGPSPRPVGSQMLLQSAAATGYLSGGCIESDIANHAHAVLQNGEPCRLVYGRGSPWIDIRLLCGGTLEILLERIDPDDGAVARLEALAEARRPAWWISDGTSRHVDDRPSAAPTPEQYVLRFDPPWRVLVVGGDPIALAIAQLSATAGFKTIIVRPNGPDTPPPFAGVGYLRGDVRAMIEAAMPDRWTAVVTATHDDDVDDVAILAALRAETAYVGVLGSATRVAPRRQRLIAAGLSITRVAALHAPIGTVRSGKAPWEVAISVVAEIMQTRTDRSSFALDADDDLRLMKRKEHSVEPAESPR